MKQYDKALATLLESSKINKTRGLMDGDGRVLLGPHPADLAFVAMSYARLGKTREANGALKELQKLMSESGWKRSEESMEFLGEAQALILKQ